MGGHSTALAADKCAAPHLVAEHAGMHIVLGATAKQHHSGCVAPLQLQLQIKEAMLAFVMSVMC